jgi:ABC-2 type transport system permease protein
MKRWRQAPPRNPLPTSDTAVSDALLSNLQTTEFLSAEDESAAFWQLRWRTAKTQLRQILAQARLRASLVILLSILLWSGLFIIFLEGFHFLRIAIPHPETHDEMVRVVFGMFFAALMVMLSFSAGIIMYGSLFRSPETAFLLTIPVRTERVFLYKFQDAVLMSSWGFILLGSPAILSYGIMAAAPWYYYVMMFPFLFCFVYIPTGIGAIVCLLIIDTMPRQRRLALATIIGLLIGAGCWITWSLLQRPESNLLTPTWFREMLGRLQLTERRLFPSWWLSSGLLEAARDGWSESLMFLALLFSNALFARQVALWTAGRIFRPAYSKFYGSSRKRRKGRAALIDRAIFTAMRLFSRQTGLLMVKDFRLLRRDPMQWSQFLIFFGLLGLYFLNVRRFNYDLYYVGWVNMVSFLNLFVVGLLMSTFTTRFIFPMISLESQRFWLLGLLPVRRETILWSKFIFAVGASILPCSFLILLSDLMLDIPGMVIASHQLTCLILCLGLSGISVGLGAVMPNLREASPSRIAAGFGGTLCLAISTIFIIIVVLMTALPCHFLIASENSNLARTALDSEDNVLQMLKLWLLSGTIISVMLGILATAIPLGMGFRAFRRMEF